MDQIQQAVNAIIGNPLGVILNGLGGVILFLIVVSYLRGKVYPSE